MPDIKNQWPDKMRRAQEGDGKAYGELLEYSARTVQPFLAARLKQASDVDDVTQEILLSIHKARATYDPTRPYEPWLFSIAQFRLNDFLRRHYQQVAREVVDTDFVQTHEAATSHTQAPDAGDLRQSLTTAMNTLPEQQRHVVHLMKVQGFSVQEVAVRLDMSVSNVKVTAHRAYKALRDYFEKEERS